MSTLINPVPIDYLEVENNLSAHSLQYHEGLTTTTTNGSLVLTVNSESIQVFDGSATGFSIILPNATTLVSDGGTTTMWHYIVVNNSSQPIDVKNNSGTTLFSVGQKSFLYTYLKDNSSTNGEWLSWQVLMSSVASGVISYNISSAVNFTTSSTTDVAITGFSVIPQAGTYAAWFNSDATCTQNNSVISHSFYKDNTVISDSIRRTQSVSSNFIFQQTTMTIAQFNGSQECSIRVKTSQGSLTVRGRSILLIRLGT